MDYQLISHFIVRYTAKFAKRSSFVRFPVELIPISQNSKTKGEEESGKTKLNHHINIHVQAKILDSKHL